MDIRYENAKEEDIPELTKVMKRSFDDDSQRHLGIPEGGPPGYDNGEFFRQWLLPYKESHGYNIFYDDKLCGFILVWVNTNNENRIGTIFIDPEYQRLGIGANALRFVEKKYSETNSWILDTPKFAKSNHIFYTRNGYKKIDEIDEEGFVQYIFKKDMTNS